jgi:uncharacterized phage protein gp47/JayE
VNIGSLGVVAPGTLNQIQTPIDGWTAVTNPLHTTDGLDTETEEAFRVRRDIEVRTHGASNLPAILAAVEGVTGVVAVTGDENPFSTARRGIPSGGIRVIVWDTEAHNAAAADIAAAIYAARPPGTPMVGAQSYDVTLPNGEPLTIRWDYAVPLRVYLAYNAAGTYDEIDILAAIRNAFNSRLGRNVIWSKVLSAVSDVSGVTDAVLALGLTPSPTASGNIAVTFDQIPVLYSVNGILV